MNSKVCNIFQTLTASFAFYILCLTYVSAQSSVGFTTLTRNDGLSHNNVYTIFQDRYGFMWFGTQNGLDRYDGYTFNQFNHDLLDDNSLSSNDFGQIIDDEHGNLWIGTNKGLDCLNPITNRFTHFSSNSKNKLRLTSANISKLALDKKGILWVATLGGGLNKVNMNTFACSHYLNNKSDTTSISSNDIFAIAIDSINNLWIGTSYSLDYFDTKNNKFIHYTIGYEGYDERKHVTIKSLIIDKYNILWIGTSNGLFSLDSKSKKLTSYEFNVTDINSIADNSVNVLLEDSNNDIWIGTDNGLSRFSRIDKTFTNYTYNLSVPMSISNNRIISLFQDRSDVLWIGTEGGGVNKLDLKRKKFYNWDCSSNNKRGLFQYNILSIAVDSSKNLWLGTKYNGVSFCRINKRRIKCSDVEFLNRNNVPDEEILSMCSNKGKIWLGMHTGGLASISNKKDKYIVKTYKNTNDSTGISNNQVEAIIRDNEGLLWIATRNGLNKMIDTSKTDEPYFITYKHSFSQNNSLCDNYTNSLLQDSKGYIWVGTHDKGVDRLDIKTNNIKHFSNKKDKANSLSSNLINSIFEDSSGRIWIATADHGLNLLNADDSTFTRYNTENGLASNQIMAILEDSEKNLWISTSVGIVMFNTNKEEFTLYDISDGIINDGFNKNSALRDEQGWMYFGTNSGLVYFHPAEIKINTIKPDIVIQKLSILKDKKWVSKDVFVSKYNENNKQISLDNDENIFLIEFSALDYSNPNKNLYQYKIDEINEDWIDYGNQRKIMITNLKSGSYTFRIRGSNNDGLFNEEGVTLLIDIEPAFIETAWFYVILSLLAIILSLWIYSYFIKLRTNYILAVKNKDLEDANLKLLESENNLKQLNQSKDKFFSIIAHDLRNPFSSLLSLSELLDNDYELLDNKEKRAYTKEIRLGAKRLYDLLENLLHWSLSQTKKIVHRPEEINLKDLIEINMELLSINAEKKAIKLIQDFEKNKENQYKVFADENMLNSVVRNLLNNAIKFSSNNSEIIVGVQETNDYFVVEVKDSGIGIAPDNTKTIFSGLSKYRLDSKKGNGSGLGLILCKEFVEINGGKIWVQSELNKGSSFFFTVKKC